MEWYQNLVIWIFLTCFSSPHPASTLWNACPACHACVCGRRSSQHRLSTTALRPSVRTLLFPIFLRCYPRRSLARRCDGFGFGNNFTSVVDSSEQAASRTRQRRLRFSRKVREEGHRGEQGFFSVTVKVKNLSCQISKLQKVKCGYFQFPIAFLPELKQI